MVVGWEDDDPDFFSPKEEDFAKQKETPSEHGGDGSVNTGQGFLMAEHALVHSPGQIGGGSASSCPVCSAASPSRSRAQWLRTARSTE